MKSTANNPDSVPLSQLTFIKNSQREGPGLLETFATERAIPFRMIDLSAGEALPDSASCQAVVILGGSASANSPAEPIVAELDFTRQLLADGIPVLGICLGMQILAKAAGGTVNIHSIREMGVLAPDRRPYTMALSEAGRNNRLFAGINSVFPPIKQGATSVIPVFQLHGETIVLPVTDNPDVQILATGLFCTNQAASFGPQAWGIQGHIEVTREMLETWMHDDYDLRSMDRIGLLRDFSYIQPEYERAARLIFGNFLDIAGL